MEKMDYLKNVNFLSHLLEAGIRREDVLDHALTWIRGNLDPEDVFTTGDLGSWAARNEDLDQPGPEL